ncbi:MAG: ribonuclease H-like domain-containing protein [Betaproteobacteria bacterium]|nr:ribonuclease H-like domain-containing protein [Betaproteobacteria bacterium]
MNLKRRITLLRTQSGHADGAPSAAAPPQPSFKERVEQLRRPENPRTPMAACERDTALAQRLNGRLVADGLIEVDDVFPLAHAHGHRPLARLLDAPLGTLAPGGASDPEGLLLVDTETTGLAGGTGTIAFLLGLGRIERAGLRVRQLFLTRFSGEGALLARALEWFQAANTIVSFNGKCFDLPLLATRYRLHRMQAPFQPLGHLDLLHATRRLFSKSWADCRLRTAEERFLGFIRTDDLPGHLVPVAWSAFLRTGDLRSIPAVLEHNRWDIVSLAALAAELAHLYGSATHPEADLVAVARQKIASGRLQEAAEHLNGHGGRLTTPAWQLLANEYRRQGRHAQAMAIWEALAARGSNEAMEDLAKHHEHVRKDYARALDYTRALLEQAPGEARHGQRQARLMAKARRAGLLPK